MKKPSPVFRSVKSLTAAAMLCAISVVIGIFCKNFLNFANGLFRITFENLPIILSGICFGPVVGGMVGVATDLISYLLSSQVYPPNILVTVGAGVIGAMSGILSRIPLKSNTVRIVLSVSGAHLLGSMVIKTAGLYSYYGVAVLVRVPLYLVIGGIEATLLCLLYRRKSFLRLLDQMGGKL